MTITIPALPTPVPQASDPFNFDARADQFIAALPGTVQAQNDQNLENNQLNGSINLLYSQAVAQGLPQVAANAAAAGAAMLAAANSAEQASSSAVTAQNNAVAAGNAATAITAQVLSFGAVLSQGVGALVVNANGELVAAWNEPVVTSMSIDAAGHLLVSYP